MHAHACTHTFTNTHTYTHIHINTHISSYTSTHSHIYTYLQTHVDTSTDTYMLTHVHTYNTHMRFYGSGVKPRTSSVPGKHIELHLQPQQNMVEGFFISLWLEG